MKSFILLVGLYVGAVGSAFGGTLTFDDLDDSGYPPIPNGYGGFQWDNFNFMDGVHYDNPYYWLTCGYITGVVSPNNVAWTLSGTPAQMSSQTPFTLNSVYLTAAWSDTMQVEVRGFFGGGLTYDNFYTVNNTGPTLINLDYRHVDEVSFTSPSNLVLDNLVVNQVPEPCTQTLMGLAIAGLTIVRRQRR